MSRCWKKNPEDRPTFTEVREEVGVILNKRDELYGYLPLDSCQAEEVSRYYKKNIAPGLEVFRPDP